MFGAKLQLKAWRNLKIPKARKRDFKQTHAKLTKRIRFVIFISNEWVLIIKIE